MTLEEEQMKEQLRHDARIFYDSLSVETQESLLNDIRQLLYSEKFGISSQIAPFLKAVCENKLTTISHRNVYQYQNQKNQELIIQAIEASYLFKSYHLLKVFYNFREVSLEFLSEILEYSHNHVSLTN